MSLLIAPIVKNSHIWARIYFIFFKKNILKQTWKFFLIPNFNLSEKIGKAISK